MKSPTPTKLRNRKANPDEGRLERKRVQDRLAQRATRERTKNHIAYLEQRLSSLETGDQRSEISELSTIIHDLRQDNARLRSALVKIRSTVDQVVHATENLASRRVDADCQTTLSETAEAGSNEASSDHGHPGRDHAEAADLDSPKVIHDGGLAGGHETSIDETENPDTEITGLAGLDDLFAYSPTSLLEMFELGPTAWNTAWPSPFDFNFPTAEILPRVVPDAEKWDTSNGAFVSCLDSVKQRTATTKMLDLHIPFKAVMWGWDNVGPEAQHPVWASLRQVDQRVFGTWTSKAQRIALMYVCQTMIQYRENPTKENFDRVPVFLRPRPSQERIQHPAVIDFLVWPGLRDRLVFEHKKYTSTGDFSAAFVENFNFYWPYSEQDIFAFNPDTSRHEVTKVFLEHAYSLKNWTMKSGFFEKFPEMEHDIAVFEPPLSFH